MCSPPLLLVRRHQADRTAPLIRVTAPPIRVPTQARLRRVCPGEAVCWKPAARMRELRHGPCAALLHDQRVLVIGGGGARPNSAELFDPLTGAWTLTTPPNMPHEECAAVTLSDGRVLVTGGLTGQHPAPYVGIRSAEIYDPVRNGWTNVAPMLATRFAHTSVLLHDGSVLAIGGALGRSEAADGSVVLAELYDVAANAWTSANFPISHDVLRRAYVVVRPSGEAVVGSSWIPDIYVLERDRSWTLRGKTPGTSSGAGMFGLPSGELILPGSVRADSAIGDREARTWRLGAPLLTERSYTQAAQLPGGEILVLGGHWMDPQVGHLRETASAELYRPATGRWERAGRLTMPSGRYTLVALDRYRVLALTGGSRYESSAGDRAEVLDIRDVAPGCAGP